MAIFFAAQLETCMSRNELRTRRVNPEIITRQYELFRPALLHVLNEGWSSVFVLPEDGTAVVDMGPPRGPETSGC
jgi:predicted kinase